MTQPTSDDATQPAKPPPAEKAPAPTICLTMIVRARHYILHRCLVTCAPLIDTFSIVVDDDEVGEKLEKFIYEFFKHYELDGSVYRRPFIQGDFAANRNRALDLARGSATFDMLVDGDDILVMEPPWPIDPGVVRNIKAMGGFWELDASIPCYFAKFSEKAWILDEQGKRTDEFVMLRDHYRRVFLLRQDSGLRYEGLAHEVIDAPQDSPTVTWPEYLHLGDDAQTDEERVAKHRRDAALLETMPPTPRNLFHLAQSWQDAGKRQKALETYHAALNVALQDQEVAGLSVKSREAAQAYAFAAAHRAAKLRVALQGTRAEVERAFDLAETMGDVGGETRAEPAYDLAIFLETTGHHEAAVAAAKRAVEIVKKFPQPRGLFVDRFVYAGGAAHLLKRLAPPDAPDAAATSDNAAAEAKDVAT